MGATIDEIIDSLKRGQGKKKSSDVGIKMAFRRGNRPADDSGRWLFSRNGTGSGQVS
mgnify:CR=1 FL=1